MKKYKRGQGMPRLAPSSFLQYNSAVSFSVAVAFRNHHQHAFHPLHPRSSRYQRHSHCPPASSRSHGPCRRATTDLPWRRYLVHWQRERNHYSVRLRPRRACVWMSRRDRTRHQIFHCMRDLCCDTNCQQYLRLHHRD